MLLGGYCIYQGLTLNSKISFLEFTQLLALPMFCQILYQKEKSSVA